MAYNEKLTAAGLRERLFKQIDLACEQPFSIQTAQAIAALATSINKSWEMQIALENLKRSVKIPKKEKP